VATKQLSELLRDIAAEMREWLSNPNAGSPKSNDVMLDHWETRLVALAQMADKKR